MGLALQAVPFARRGGSRALLAARSSDPPPAAPPTCLRRKRGALRPRRASAVPSQPSISACARVRPPIGETDGHGPDVSGHGSAVANRPTQKPNLERDVRGWEAEQPLCVAV